MNIPRFFRHPGHRLAAWCVAVGLSMLAGCAALPAAEAPIQWSDSVCGTQWLGQSAVAAGPADVSTVSPRLLTIQCEGQSLRFVMVDPLGVPMARQILAQGQWRADGLLPPAPAARVLFSALLFGLAGEPEGAAASAYPGLAVRVEPHGGRSLWRDGQRLWTVSGSADAGLRIDFPEPVEGTPAWSWQMLPGDEGRNR